MIKIENLDVSGFDHAVRAMRNPLNSWEKSDSEFEYEFCSCIAFDIGENDLSLMQKLFKGGSEQRTYARMIQVYMDITAPLYWWKEMDRYTVGKSQVACSTMHKIAAKEFELDDFSHEHLDETLSDATNALKCLKNIIYCLNYHRMQFISTKDKKYWWQMIQLLPSSYNQRRTVCMSYETVFKIIKERTNHKLDEWNDLVKILKDLPYVKEIMNGSET